VARSISVQALIDGEPVGQAAAPLMCLPLSSTRRATTGTVRTELQLDAGPRRSDSGGKPDHTILAMGLLTFAINVTLDGCVDHREGIADDETHDFFTRLMDESRSMLWGRVTCEMMESYWPAVARGAEEASPAMREWPHPHAMHVVTLFLSLR
jgi:hypothetical protein